MKLLSKEFYEHFYDYIKNDIYDEDEEVELEIDYKGETYMIYGIARFEDKVYTSDRWDGSHIETTQSVEREFDEIEITKIEKL